MITLARLVSALALAGTLLPPLVVMAGRLGVPAMKSWMLASTAAWFMATPFWMDRRPTGAPDSRKPQ